MLREDSVDGAVVTTPRAAGATRPRVLDSRVWTRLCFVTDLVALGSAAATAVAATPTDLSLSWPGLIFPTIVMALLHTRPGSDRRVGGSLADTATDAAGALARATVVALALCALAATPDAGRVIVRDGLITAVYLVLARGAIMTMRRRTLRSSLWARPTIIVGAGAVGESLAKRLLDEPSYGLRPVGYIDADPRPSNSRAGARLPLLGDLDNLTDAIRRAGASHLIAAFSSEPDHELVQKLGECEQLGVEVLVVPRLYEAINERAAFACVGGLPVFMLHPTDPYGWQFAVKHALDRTIAAIALLALAPLMVTIAIAVQLTSPGPVLFRQRRVGRDGQEFTLLKFRTMREQRRIGESFAPRPGLAPGGIEGDDRRTGLGRFLRDLSLDELPQFVNVLRGEMSLVGPRPERPEYVRKFAHEISRYENRHRVKSGITGWAQVHGLRGQTSIADRVECDNYYVQNWSLRLDLRIYMLTILELTRRRGDRR